MYNEIASNKRKTAYLLFGFFVLIAGLSWILSEAYDSTSILVYSGIFAVVYTMWSYFASSKLALTINGAQEIQKNDNPRLFRVVENLAITDGLPMPKVYMMNDSGLNAFATGRDPKHASVAITSGLLEVLDDSELQGVMAHELGHIKNYDIRVSMIAFALVGIVSLLCDFFLRASFWGVGFGGDNDDDGPSGNSIMMVVAIIALVLAPIVAMLMQLAISRKREYLADATGALTTRYPEGLARALEKIRDGGSATKRQNTSTAHFFIANPLRGKSISSLLSTHPPIDERIKILRGMIGNK